jgi:hypothetical protein
VSSVAGSLTRVRGGSQFLGLSFVGNDVWLCMEYMEGGACPCCCFLACACLSVMVPRLCSRGADGVAVGPGNLFQAIERNRDWNWRNQ